MFKDIIILYLMPNITVKTDSYQVLCNIMQSRWLRYYLNAVLAAFVPQQGLGIECQIR